jgi:hypothetical protein
LTTTTKKKPIGWRQALAVAHATLEASAVDHKSDKGNNNNNNNNNSN